MFLCFHFRIIFSLFKFLISWLLLFVYTVLKLACVIFCWSLNCTVVRLFYCVLWIFQCGNSLAFVGWKDVNGRRVEVALLFCKCKFMDKK